MGYLVFLNEMIVERGLECYGKKINEFEILVNVWNF